MRQNLKPKTCRNCGNKTNTTVTSAAGLRKRKPPIDFSLSSVSELSSADLRKEMIKTRPKSPGLSASRCCCCSPGRRGPETRGKAQQLSTNTSRVRSPFSARASPRDRSRPDPRKLQSTEVSPVPAAKKPSDPRRERISQLGLDILYLRGRRKDPDPHCAKEKHETTACAKDTDELHAGKETQQRSKIRDYIRKKNVQAVKQRKEVEAEKRSRQERIQGNISRLHDAVQVIFSPSKKRSVSREKNAIAKKRKKTAATKETTPSYSRILETVEAERTRVKNLMSVRDSHKTREELAMDRVRFQLQKEIPPIPASAEPKSHQPHKTNVVSSNKKAAGTLRRRKNLAAAKIQAQFRGFMVRRRYREIVFDGNIPGLEASSVTEKVVCMSRINPSVEELEGSSSLRKSPAEKETDSKPTQEIGTATESQVRDRVAMMTISCSVTGISVGQRTGEAKKRPLDFTSCPTESLPASPPPKIHEEEKGRAEVGVEAQPEGEQRQQQIVARVLQLEIPSVSPRREKRPTSEAATETPATPKNQLQLTPASPSALSGPSSATDRALEKDIYAKGLARSIFDRKTFREFMLRRMGSAEEQVSSLISAQEQVIGYREGVEKRYMMSLYKERQLSPKVYHRRKKELEKWVTREKEETKQVRNRLLESWQRTAEMIESAQTNASLLRKLLSNNTVSCANYSNSLQGSTQEKAHTFDESEGLAALRERYEKEGSRNLRSTQNVLKPFEEEQKALLPRKSGGALGEVSPVPDAILVQDDTTDAIEPEGEKKKEESHAVSLGINISASRQKRDAASLLEVATVPKKETIESQSSPTPSPEKMQSFAEEIVGQIYATLVDQTLTGLFPQRSKAPMPDIIAIQERPRGIRTDLYQISDYLDELFAVALTEQRQKLMAEVNQPLARDPHEVLEKLQSADPEQQNELHQFFKAKMPHEIDPIMKVDTYLEVEGRNAIFREGEEEGTAKDDKQKTLVTECDHIHKKAIFDSVNEALNLIRPYGLAGAPMPWSNLQRILFTKINCPSIIVTNIKNMVLSSYDCGRCWTGEASSWARCRRRNISRAAHWTRIGSTKSANAGWSISWLRR